MQQVKGAAPDFRESVFGRLGHGNVREQVEPLGLEVDGTLPPDLCGTLYRNGPGGLEVAGQPIKNVIDGDGYVQALRITPPNVSFVGRYVDTETRRAERRAGRPLYGGFSQTAPRGPWSWLRGQGVRRPANTHIFMHRGRLFAGYENDALYALEPRTLQTLGRDTLDGALPPGGCISAHPKLHAPSQSMVNQGKVHDLHWSLRGPTCTTSLRIYERDAAGHTPPPLAVPVPYPAALVHDLVVTEARRALVVVSPLVAEPTVSVVLGLAPPSAAVRWRPELPSYLQVVDLDARTVQATPFAASLCFHLANGWEADGHIFVDICAFADDRVVRVVENLRQGGPLEQHAATLRRLHLEPGGTLHTTVVSTTPLDFPRIAPLAAGRAYRYLFGITWGDATEPLPTIPVTLDLEDNRTFRRPLEPGDRAGELCPVAKRDALRELDAYLLSMVYSGATKRRELRIYDAADPSAQALCRVLFPADLPLPYGFHTSFLRHEDEPAGNALA